MANVLEEVLDEEITKEYVVKRVDDWLKRLNDLYDLVESWLPSGWRAERQKSARMDERMMQRFQIEARQVPVLELTSPSGEEASLQPRGLWIIGVNGRVDLYAGDRHFLILDRSESFARPDWAISDFYNRSKVDKFDRATLIAALGK